jgi:hypothetical protein
MRTAVFITVDTEVWPRHPEWRTTLSADMDRDIYGVTKSGEYGLRYQLDMLDRFGLKAVFLVESLFATVVGQGPLVEIVKLIQAHRQDVQLHVHPEWLEWMPNPLVSGTRSPFLKDFSKDEQHLMLATAVANLQQAGTESVTAFRAGNYGANLDTLIALRDTGVLYDTSYNVPYLSTQCGIAIDKRLLQPQYLEGIIEYPITFFEDWPGHQRHFELTACSSAEIEHVLLTAHSQGWGSVVLVSHSFELLKNRNSPGKPLQPDRICVKRFERLCQFLSERTDQFVTSTFNDLATPNIVPVDVTPMKSNVFRTLGRFGEQAARRLP